MIGPNGSLGNFKETYLAFKSKANDGFHFQK